MYNCHHHTSGSCSCPHCEDELKNGCISPKFCKPCLVQNKNIEVCSLCGAQYSSEYDKCPSCSVMSN